MTSFISIVSINFTDCLLKLRSTLVSFLIGILLHGLGFAAPHRDFVVFFFFLLVGSHSTSEDVLVFLIREVDIVVSVWVRVLGGVVPVILPDAVRSEVASLSVFPGLELQIANGSSPVVSSYTHCPLVSFVVDNFSSQVPLLLFSQTF